MLREPTEDETNELANAQLSVRNMKAEYEKAIRNRGEKVAKIYRRGVSPMAIANSLGVTKHVVWKVIQRFK